MYIGTPTKDVITKIAVLKMVKIRKALYLCQTQKRGDEAYIYEKIYI